MGFEVSGIESVIAEIDEWTREHDERVMRAVKKGGQYFAEQLRVNVPVHFGHLKKSIKVGPMQYSSTDGFHVIVGPTGNDPVSGEPMAKIGNVVEYGHGKVPAIPYMRTTVENETEATQEVMRQEFEREG